MLNDVQFVPSLAHNLLSVGQLMNTGYVVIFDNNCCTIRAKNSDHTLLSISMTESKMFPVDISTVKSCAMIAICDEATL